MYVRIHTIKYCIHTLYHINSASLVYPGTGIVVDLVEVTTHPFGPATSGIHIHIKNAANNCPRMKL